MLVVALVDSSRGIKGSQEGAGIKQNLNRQKNSVTFVDVVIVLAHELVQSRRSDGTTTHRMNPLTCLRRYWRGRWCEKVNDDDFGPESSTSFDTEFSVFLCQSHKWLATVQCIFYAIHYIGRCLSSFYLDFRAGQISAAEWEELDLTCNALNCSSTSVFARDMNYSITTALIVESIPLTVVYMIQVALFVTTPVLIWKSAYQKKWRLHSTVLSFVSGLFGSVLLDVWMTYHFIIPDATQILANPHPTSSDVRVSVVTILQLGILQRVAGLEALQLLSFAPRFGPFITLCGILVLVESVCDMYAIALINDAITTGVSPMWEVYMSFYTYTLFGEVLVANISAYAVPAGLLWVFERMLHSKLCAIALRVLSKQVLPFRN